MKIKMFTFLAFMLQLNFAAYAVPGPGCIPVYGSNIPCSFVPAPPGHTPPCALPGQTYCEKLDHYPMQLIRHLIDKWGYDHTTLIQDETTVEFNSNRGLEYSPKYQQNQWHPEPIYIPKPSQGYQHSTDNYNNGYQYPQKNFNNNFKDTYLPPKIYNFGGNGTFQGYRDDKPLFSPNIDQPSTFTTVTTQQSQSYTPVHYSDNFPNQKPFYNGNPFAFPDGVTQYNPNDWWRRYRRSTESQKPPTNKRAKKSIETHESSPNLNPLTGHHSRPKRQAATDPNRDSLCAARSQYVTPKAALNSRGSWMYVVNVGEEDNRYTQLVKTETCVTQECSGLCQLPNGYSSRCEQKYVQKRLVALQSGGEQLYTDTFWIPSCCLCTISNTN